jgi:serine phosphatase RsbU (regulator of sigma subunit)
VRDPAGNEYGRERLLRELAADRGRIEPMTEQVMEAARAHAGGRPPEDDLTLLLAEFGQV